MSNYQWAVEKGRVIEEDYHSRNNLDRDGIINEIRNAFFCVSNNVTVYPVSDDNKDVYEVEYSKEGEKHKVYICAKVTTPGGRSNLKNEQRIQVKAKNLNYVYQKNNNGKVGINLGIYKHNSETIYCTWKVTQSTAQPEIPCSKQIKISTIAKALSEGFVQQHTAAGEYVCAFKKEFIYFYLKNSSWIHDEVYSNLNNHYEDEEEIKEIEDDELTDLVGTNKLYYGVPGAGKSFKINNEIVIDRTERVVFHPDYTYSDFIGQILPKVIKLDNGEEKLRYKFTAGPFTKILKKAYKDKNHMYYLVIEEINRGNAPAIFGDTFQLLDRDDDGSSKYEISNDDIADVVYGKSEDEDVDRKIKIPSNLTLYATMNTSDQNIFTLDTAFQRRWEMHLVPNDVENAIHATKNIGGSNVNWGQFAEITNEEIIRAADEMGGAEDKRLGAYFATESELDQEKFPEKVLKYLWDDVFKMDRHVYFNDDMGSLDQVIKVFKENTSNEDALKRILSYSVYSKMLVEKSNGSLDEEQEDNE